MEIFYSNNIQGDYLFLSQEESQHCIRVLRNKVGDVVKVSCGDGNLYLSRIENADSTSTKLKIISQEGDFGKHNYFLHIAIAPTKNMERFEIFLEKGTEIGIDEITPLICDHSERRVIKQERCERVILAAAKQSLKGKMPYFNSLTPFNEFIKSTSSFKGEKYIAFCDNELIDNKGNPIERIHIEKRLRELYEKNGGNTPEVIVLIGPEGDFSKKEVESAISSGFLPISLGNSRLRTETAAIIVCCAIYLQDQ